MSTAKSRSCFELVGTEAPTSSWSVSLTIPAGQPLASVSISSTSGERVDLTLRRRVEVNEGIIGWGSAAFRALPHRVEALIDRRGPHVSQSAGRYAPAGQTNPLTIMPGGWGSNQTGVENHVPSPTDDLMLR